GPSTTKPTSIVTAKSAVNTRNDSSGNCSPRSNESTHGHPEVEAGLPYSRTASNSMCQEPPVILAINPGTRYVGFAMFRGPELVDWGLRVITAKTPRGKVKAAGAILT